MPLFGGFVTDTLSNSVQLSKDTCIYMYIIQFKNMLFVIAKYSSHKKKVPFYSERKPACRKNADKTIWLMKTDRIIMHVLLQYTCFRQRDIPGKSVPLGKKCRSCRYACLLWSYLANVKCKG